MTNPSPREKGRQLTGKDRWGTVCQSRATFACRLAHCRTIILSESSPLGYRLFVKRLVIKSSRTIRRRTYDLLREQLLSGEIPPHHHLIETKIAKLLGTSRTPVREAFHSLELEGLIESIPRVGYVVKPISEEEVSEICQIRAAIEGLAACWAMEKDCEKLIRELEKNISLTEERISEGDVRAFIDMDARFHETISRLSGSKRLLDMAQSLRRHMLRYRIQSIYSVENVLRAVQGHKEILKAIKKKKMEGVRGAIQHHLEQSRKDVLRYAFQEVPTRRDRVR
jgi:GntR family transcriptional regulator, rspAB operon transcriptional repressor